MVIILVEIIIKFSSLIINISTVFRLINIKVNAITNKDTPITRTIDRILKES